MSLSVTNSNPNFLFTIDNELDVYTQEKFGQLKIQRFQKDSDFYVCRLQEGETGFYFEGSKFIEHFLRNKQKSILESFVNPLTRKQITAFKVFKASPDAPDFIEAFDEKSVASHVNALPILLSSDGVEPRLQGSYYFRLAECYRLGKDCNPDPTKALTCYRKSAVLGHRDAQYNLSLLSAEEGFVRESIEWALKFCNQDPLKISIQELIHLGNCFDRFHYYAFAFAFYHEAACQGNRYAIAKVIRYYEQGMGMPNDLDKACLWKQLIPVEWHGKSSYDYLVYTCRSQEVVNPVQVPEVLKKDRAPLTFPDLQSFPERAFS